MSRHILAFALPFLFAVACHAQHLLWYDRPAENWNEALPIGNGRMGGMIYGGTSVERIQLNEDSLWAGEAKDLKNVIGTPEDLAYIRRLIADAKYAEADRELPKRFARASEKRS